MPALNAAGSAASAFRTASGSHVHKLLDAAGNIVWTHPGPRVTHFGASAGAGNRAVLTIRRDALPFAPTVSGTFPDDDAVSWELDRQGARIASGAAKTDGTFYADMRHQENLTADFRPPASGWAYRLAASNADGDSTIAVCTIRTIAAPALTAFAATAPGALQGPGVNQQAAWLTWTGAEGDPASVWTLTQTGRRIAALPSSRHLSAAQGAAAGTHRTRVQVAGGGGGSTTLTLAAANEAGEVSLATTIHWLA